YRLSVMCNIVKYRMIPHVILPVVDNFVRLASRENTPKYEINIEVTMSYENLLITIRDNGYGMDAYQLERMRREIEEDVIDYNEAYISVANVNRRIQWRYGERYGLDISSSRLGSVIRISLPTSGEE
ncbi:MAG: hypothetical protein IJC18_02790, partial [Clostridia bacterium]|nr:hypothetical protein [Clostridia bacterium]